MLRFLKPIQTQRYAMPTKRCTALALFLAVSVLGLSGCAGDALVGADVQTADAPAHATTQAAPGASLPMHARVGSCRP